MVDPAMQAAYRRALARTGETVTVQRVSGTAPRTATFSASVKANVQSYAPETNEVSEGGYGSSQIGATTQSQRKVIVVAEDLAAARFPLPVQKNDRVMLADGTKCNVTGVDAHKRQLAGAIELTVVEVQ
jgi:hypothetical protein